MKIAGKRYTLAHIYEGKSQALKGAAKLRKEGYNARVTAHPRRKGTYGVWFRKKSK